MFSSFFTLLKHFIYVYFRQLLFSIIFLRLLPSSYSLLKQPWRLSSSSCALNKQFHVFFNLIQKNFSEKLFWIRWRIKIESHVWKTNHLHLNFKGRNLIFEKSLENASVNNASGFYSLSRETSTVITNQWKKVDNEVFFSAFRLFSAFKYICT